MTDTKIIDELLDGEHTFAVVGASNNPEKYGYKIYKQLKEKGFEVYPINPREELIQGDKAYENLFQLPKQVDVLNFVVPPDVNKNVTKTAFEIGYKIFWYQPGSYDKGVLSLHDGKDNLVISDQCLLIESGKIVKD
ncbi:CoA-binding protein [Candidatus Dojkabacteria bacterium]|nr:CoA-binding protein [Candidatus Dojkabacteria bacterium]